MNILKTTLLASALSISMAMPVFANEVPVAASIAIPAPFTAAETQSLFEQDAQTMQLAALSQTEMKETEGAVIWFAPVVFHFGRIAVVRIAHHSAHHTFGSLGRLPHIQFNTWRPGVSGSGGAFRIPLPNTPFFRP